ncbi:ethanolamine ammonia-lyase subunit EutC [uncultured Jatrophihabitans sp.]|uniref:ethanolamine ammonia-lyase subunit EutC n=1 Tax=uncultured Jatrophihabitans sp. TaxID=1610747 RepID=UPI0035CB1760
MDEPASADDEPVPDHWAALRRATRARIGLGRAGNAQPMAAELAFRAAHAAARDAVHEPLDVALVQEQLADAGLDAAVQVASRAQDRAEYLRRPDLGRLLDDDADATLDAAPREREVAVVLADGLSPRAVTSHAVALIVELLPALAPRTAALVIATQARVGLGDHIGAWLDARAVLVLIGERPGLSASDSLGAYLTYAPRAGRSDAERNCVSNIRPPDGLGYTRAARILAGLVEQADAAGVSGVALKDRSAPDSAHLDALH